MRSTRVVILAALCLLSSLCAAQSAPAVADTFSNSAQATKNYGAQGSLAVQLGSVSFLKFNLATLPVGVPVNKATLRLYVDAVTTGGKFDVYQLNNSWSESALTYNNAPVLGLSATGNNGITISASSLNQFVVIDITPQVQAWASGGTNNGVALALVPGSGGSFSFDSKESTLTSHQPELEIVLNGPAGPQGPPGPTGVAGAAGTAGPAGLAGATGATGPQGATGSTGAAGSQGVPGTAGATGATGPAGALGPQGPQGPIGLTGATGAQGPMGLMGFTGAIGPAGPAGSQGLQGPSGDTNARMIFPSFFPGNLSGTWIGGKLALDQPITVLRIAAAAKTPTGVGCPAAVFRFGDGTKGQDLVLTAGQNWSDSGPITLTYAAGATLQASLRTGSTCPSNTGADANLLVEYKAQDSGDADSCPGTLCSGFCETPSSDPANCGSCGTVCASGQPCVSGQCTSTTCGSGQTNCNGTCVNLQSNTNNCGSCGTACPSGDTCTAGACVGGAVGQSCTSDINCLSNACDLITNKCASSQCADQRQDSSETAVDCGGGVCPTCPVGQTCGQNDANCTSNACDANSNTCVSNQCADHRQDGVETAVDCGGGVCPTCGFGQTCGDNDANCTSNACDAISNLCVSNQCADHRRDGSETDIDCGGSACAACAVGQKCLNNFDCQSGHFCGSGVCQ